MKEGGYRTVVLDSVYILNCGLSVQYSTITVPPVTFEGNKPETVITVSTDNAFKNITSKLHKKVSAPKRNKK